MGTTDPVRPAKPRTMLMALLIGAALAAPAGYVWNQLGVVQSELPNYGFYLIRDLRFAFADVSALDRTLSLMQQAALPDDVVRKDLAEAADLFQIRFDQFRYSDRSPDDEPFVRILDDAAVVEADLARALAAPTTGPEAIGGLAQDTKRLLKSLSDYTQRAEADTDRAIAHQSRRLDALKLQIFAGIAVVSGLVGLVLLLLFQHVRKNREIAAALRLDPLTGLANRRGFADWVGRTAADDGGSASLAIVVFDLDDFKPVNDRLGHVTGDALLKAAGAWLQRSFGDRGVVARWGGDEFVAALRTEGATRREIDEDLRSKLAERPVYAAGIEQIPIVFSAGAALWPADGRTHTDVIQHADLALYEAKDQGKGRFVLYDDSIAARRTRVSTIRRGLARAVRENHLFLTWQPQIDVRTHRVAGAECLLRWRDPETGSVVPPAEFIAVAETSDLIIDVDCWVLDEACRTAARWMREGCPLRVAVNISPRHFLQPTLLAHVEAALAEHGLSPRWLEAEITEGVLLNDSQTVADNLAGLSRLGIRLALDDFGTGYSNIAYLTRLRPDLLKVDRSFLRDTDLETREKVIRSILRLGESIAAETLMEGVETPEDFRFLGTVGCGLAQGYHFARPMPTGDFERWRTSYEAEVAGRAVRVRRSSRG